jgi:hypothetical protein
MTEKEMRAELKKCNTLNAMWKTLDKHYNLDTELTMLTKNVAASQLAQRVETFATLLKINTR